MQQLQAVITISGTVMIVSLEGQDPAKQRLHDRFSDISTESENGRAEPLECHITFPIFY